MDDFKEYYEWFKNLEEGDNITITCGWADFIEDLVRDYERLKKRKTKTKTIKKNFVIDALYRLQGEIVKNVLEENPKEENPEDVDDRIGEIQNTIFILENIHAKEI